MLLSVANGSGILPENEDMENATASRQRRSLVAGGGFEPPTFGR
jgi:hypothetical protein